MKDSTDNSVFEDLLKADAPLIYNSLKGNVDFEKLSEEEKMHLYASGASNNFDEDTSNSDDIHVNPKLIAEVMKQSAPLRRQYLPKKRLLRYHKTTIALAASVLLVLSVHIFMMNTYMNNSISIMDYTNIETTAYGLTTRGQKGSVITHSRFQDYLKKHVEDAFEVRSGRTTYKLVIRPNQKKEEEIILYLYNQDFKLLGSKSMQLSDKAATDQKLKEAVQSLKNEI